MRGPRRGEVWWADLPAPRGSEPGYRRPVLIIQADAFNSSRIQTIIAAVFTSNLDLASAPGNVLVPARISGLAKDSVVNVSQVITLDRSAFTERVGTIPARVSSAVDVGLRQALRL
jgi:mRNA interferase MazF